MGEKKILSSLCLVFILILSVLVGCNKNKSTFEKEKSDLKKRAYDINYQFVNEASIVSLLAKKIKLESNLKSNDFHSPLSLTNKYECISTGSSQYQKQMPFKADTVISRNEERLIFTSRLVFGLGSDYCIYPKMNTKFLNLEETDFDYDPQTETDSLDSFVNPWRLTPVFHPLDASPVIRYVEYVDQTSNTFVAAHFSLQKVFDSFLNPVDGTFMLIDRSGNIIAMSDDAFFITGLRKPKYIHKTAKELRVKDLAQMQTIYDSSNESFRRNIFEIIRGDKKRGAFIYSDKEYTVISSSIKQIKWQLIRIL